MEVKKQSFFVQLRKLAAHLDRGKRICQNLESDGQSQTTCIDSLKGFAEELQEKLVGKWFFFVLFLFLFMSLVIL